MQFSPEAIEKFREIWKQEFGEEISRDKAHGAFLRLTNLLRIVLKPIPVKNTPKGSNPPGGVPLLEPHVDLKETKKPLD
ncbi:MAG: hypothetical protein AAB581_02400 [Patescibacteria group bacterium]